MAWIWDPVVHLLGSHIMNHLCHHLFLVLAGLAGEQASRSFFTCSDVLCLLLLFSASVEGLLLTALHVGCVDMMDGTVEGWMKV